MTTDFPFSSRTGETYLIAEMSANHNGDFRKAVELIHAAKDAGADAVKVQTYTADTLTLDCSRAPFVVKGGTLWDGRTLHELYRQAAMNWEWQPELKREAEKIGLDFFSTPFDASAVDFLETLNVALYKIASFELIDIPLLKRVAATGKPVIMSTGMGTVEEIAEAVRTLRENGCPQLALLKCTSSYPALPEQMNLRTISNMSETFNCPAGLSDHSMSLAVVVAAVCCGATIIEKHFCLSRADKGVDSEFSLEPGEFQQMAAAVREAEKALGLVSYGLTERETGMRHFRKSLFVAADIKAGEIFTPDNLRCVRPGNGLHPRYYETVIGRVARQNLQKGQPLEWGMF